MKIPKTYWILSAALLVVNLAAYLTGLGGPDVVQWTGTILPILCAFIGIAGVAMAVGAFKVWDAAKTAWLLLAVGLALSSLGEISYMTIESILGYDVESIGYTAADVFWILSYLPLLFSLFILMNRYRKSGLPMGGMKRNIAFGILGFLAFAALFAWILLPIALDPESELLDKVVYLYYPIVDFLLLVPAVGLVLITSQFGKGSFSIPWKSLALAFLVWVVADLLYSYLGDAYDAWSIPGIVANYLGEDYSVNLVDMLWNGAYLLIGAAGLSQRALLRSV